MWRTLVSLVVCFVAVPGLCEEPVPLAETPVDVYHLQNWGQRKFNVYMSMTEKHREAKVSITEREMHFVATQTFSTEVKNDEVIMRQYWLEPTLKRGGALVTYHCHKDSLLSLARMQVQRDAKTYLVDVTQGEFNLEFLTKTRGGKYPADTVTDASLMRLVTLLPHTPGKQYSIGHRTATPEINVISGAASTIQCIGPDDLEIQKTRHECTKFICGETMLWVRTSDKMLVRLEVPGWKILELHDTNVSLTDADKNKYLSATP
jgi:hypothetical protein